MRRTALILVLFAMAPLACGDQAPADYQGEPLARLHGQLENQLPNPPSDLDLVLVWLDYDRASPPYTGQAGDLAIPREVPYGVTQRVPITTGFPSLFDMEIFQPPPANAYLPLPQIGPTLIGPRFAQSLMFLVKHGTEFAGPSIAVDPVNGPIFAEISRFNFLYIDGDGTVSSRDADGVLQPLAYVTKGYHLYRDDSQACYTSLDQACVDRERAAAGGVESTAYAYRCATTSRTGTSTELPLDQEFTFIVPDPNAPEPTLIPCPPSTN